MHPVWPVAEPIETGRLTLEPLRVEHAEEMAPLFDDSALHEFIGGQPASADQLRDRYARQVIGRSRDGTQGWLNWAARQRASGDAVGTVQATLTVQDNTAATITAEVAWVVARRHQAQGYAAEAAVAMVGWLHTRGIGAVVAHIHPDHLASIGVARHLGLTPTSVVIDGEVRWTS